MFSCKVTGLQHVVDHALQPHGSAVLNRKYSAHPIFVQFVDLPIRDHSATTAKDVNMCCASLLQQINHILKILHVPALIRTDRNALDILLNRSEERRVGKQARASS